MLRFVLLGPVGVNADGGGAIALPPMARTLLAALLLRVGRRSARENLIGLLWDDPPKSAEANLRQHFSILRTRLAEHGCSERLITIRGGGGGGSSAYELVLEADELDVTVFTTHLAHARAALRDGDQSRAISMLAAASALWQGRAGEDVTGSRLLREHLAGLDALRAEAEVDLCELRLHREPARHLLGDLRRLITAHPLWERPYLLLAQALWESGDPAAALGTLHRAREVLGEELGLVPSRQFHRLYTCILRHEPVAAAG
ncbi:AfsR/SARP family transcriptional regulator [Microbispora sp. NBRC 16548]|uniref:AfsR/SARP family transcriptional regulator n=1 Tax=Microbispora sp. NBRC 16548 TaxID=3030994 RepID=UPI00162304E5|nr:AfsR/SARP family transcriptional regulator [Microbispora sp. NBRC 16548]